MSSEAVPLSVETMRNGDMRHFVVVYDRRSGLKDLQRFSADRHADAVDTRYELEDEYRDDPHVEVVLLSAASEDVIRHTHGRYFKTFAELATLD